MGETFSISDIDQHKSSNINEYNQYINEQFISNTSIPIYLILYCNQKHRGQYSTDCAIEHHRLTNKSNYQYHLPIRSMIVIPVNVTLTKYIFTNKNNEMIKRNNKS